MDAAIERLEKALVGTCIGEPLDVLPRVMAAGAAAEGEGHRRAHPRLLSPVLVAKGF